MGSSPGPPPQRPGQDPVSRRGIVKRAQGKRILPPATPLGGAPKDEQSPILLDNPPLPGRPHGPPGPTLPCLTMTQAPIRYLVLPKNLAAHRFEVTCEVDNPSPSGQVFALPAWIPGSYLIREFARNIVSIRAEQDGQPVPLHKLDKHRWRAARPGPESRGPLRVIAEVHAWDLSVRGAHLDRQHGFFNGTQLFLQVQGQEEAACRVHLQAPTDPAGANWQVATTLEREDDDGNAPVDVTDVAFAPRKFGWFRAENYGELIDHPVEMGQFTWLDFPVDGVPHAMAITGPGIPQADAWSVDQARLQRDLTRICAEQQAVFPGPSPFSRYLFLTMTVGDGYGGLEHGDCTALIAAREDLPRPPQEGEPALRPEEPDVGYTRFLGLCAHEYFHAWHVKRIRPESFVAPDLGREAYTRLLWCFEGFTSYYDDLALVRSGVISPEAYLELLAKTLTQVAGQPGRRVQSLADSSFDAWIKYYRPDDNTPNAVVSYYAKGSLTALALDLHLRWKSKGRVSLDDVMARLWQEHGLTGRGVSESARSNGIYGAVSQVGGSGASSLLRQWVEGTEDLPLEALFKEFGLTLHWQTDKRGPWVGLRLAGGTGSSDETGARVSHVLDESPAQLAGLAPGDQIVAVDGLRATTGNLDRLFARRGAGQGVEVVAFRRDELFSTRLVPEPSPANQASIKLQPGSHGKARQLRLGWLASRAQPGEAAGPDLTPPDLPPA